MKKMIVVFGFILIVTTFFGCTNGKEVTVTETKIKPVKAIKVNEESSSVTLEYLGTVNTEDLKKYSFKVPGTIEQIYVVKGQMIKAGESLAKIETTDLDYQLSAANEQVKQAQAQYNKAVSGATEEEIKKAEINVKKAQDAYNYAKDYYQKLEELYKNESITKQDLDQGKLELDMREADLQLAKEIEQEAKKGLDQENKKAIASQLEQAKINRNQKKDMLDNATLKAEMDGQVVDILYRTGEIVNSGYPVILVKSNHMVIRSGVTQEDVEKIKEGQTAKVKINDRVVEGVVSFIDSIPDQQTRTYNVEIELKETNFKIGMIGKVSFIIGEEKGIWIPISSVMTNGTDYVFVIENNKAMKKKISLGSIKGSMVLTNGLKPGDQVVVEGMKEITDGEIVEVIIND